MDYDPTQYVGSAPYYLPGRPPYSTELGQMLARELGLDGTGRLLDVGSGPGVVGVQLAPWFAHVTLLEPDPGMLAEARVHAADLPSVDFIRATAGELAGLRLPPMRVVTFGQSFHRVDRPVVAEAVFELLEPGGSLVLITHDPTRPPPRRPDLPAIPHEEIRDLIRRRLGGELRSGRRPVSDYVPERFEETLARTSFGGARILHAPGRPDIVRDLDGVVAGVLSMSYAAPHLFGSRLEEFLADLRTLLLQHSPSGRFWDWPGDTELVIATKA